LLHPLPAGISRSAGLIKHQLVF